MIKVKSMLSNKWFIVIVTVSIILFSFAYFNFINANKVVATTPADEARLKELYDRAPNKNPQTSNPDLYVPTTGAEYGYDATKDGAKPLNTPRNRSYINGYFGCIIINLSETA